MGLDPLFDLWDEYACRAVAWLLKRGVRAKSARLQMLIIDLERRR